MPISFRFLPVAVGLAVMAACAQATPTTGPPAPPPQLNLEQRPAGQCETGKEPWRAQGAPKRGGTFVAVGFLTDLDATRPPTKKINFTYESLVRLRACLEQDDVVVPGLAKSWDVTPDGLTWTFKLRDDVRWQNVPPVNGRPLSSADVAWSIDHQKTGGDVKPLWDPVEHQEPDAQTVVLRLKTPQPDFLSQLAYISNVVVPREIFEQNKDFKNLAVGTGPFIIRSFQPNQSLVAERNPSYYLKVADGQSLPYLDRFELTNTPDRSAALAAFRTGQADGLPGGLTFTKPEADALRQSNAKVTMQTVMLNSTWGLYFNATKKPFDSPLVRRAFSLAMDREDQILGPEKGGAVYAGFMPGAIMNYVWPQQKLKEKFAPNPNEAKKLLTEAGLSAPLEVEIKTVQIYAEGAEVAAKQLEAIGVKSKIVVEQSNSRAQMAQGDFSLLWGAYPQSNLPGYWMSDIVKSGSNINYMRFSDARVDALAAAQGRETDVGKRKQIINDLQDRLYETMPYAPAVSKVIFQFYSCKVQNMKPYHFALALDGVEAAWLDPSKC